MGENNEGRPSFSSLILHRHSSATIMDFPSGVSTPPLQPPASVPFKWEQEPGKPVSGIRNTTRPEPTKSCLDPPPCRKKLFVTNMDPAAGITKTPSPSSILDGPYGVVRSRFPSSRFLRDGQESSYSSAGTPHVGTMLGGSCRRSRRGFFGKFKGGDREIDGGIFGVSSSTSIRDSEERMEINGGGRKMRSIASFSSVSHARRPSHIWATIYEGVKHVIHWKSSRKEHKEGQD